MAAPLPYVPTYSFAGYQTANPTKPLPGSSLDDQLANVGQSTTDLVNALAQIQRSDGKLKNGIVTIEALSTDIVAGLKQPVPWTTATAYKVSDTVFDGPKLFICNVDHISTDFDTQLGLGYWTMLADFTPTGIVEAQSVIYDPAGSGLVATTAQAAIDELDAYLDYLNLTKASISALGSLAFLNAINNAVQVTDGLLPLAKLLAAPALSITGRAGNSDGARTDIVANTDGHVLRRDGTSISFGQIKTAGIADRAVTLAKMVSHGGIAGQASRLAMNVTSNSTVSVTAAAIAVADANGFTRVLRNVSLSLDLGASGLDTGSEASSTWYHVHIFYNDSNASATLRASLSATAPTAPDGFTFSARLGAIRNDASSNLWRTIQRGRVVQIAVGTNPTSWPRPASGSASAWTAASLVNFVPATAVAASLSARGNTNNYLGVAPNSAGVPVFEWANSNTASTYGRGLFSMLLESTSIYWSSTGGGNSIDVTGWEDSD